MKNILITILLFTGLTVFAQRSGKERIKAIKTAIITEKLDLSVAEAQQFWPVYNNFEKKLEELRKKERTTINQKLNQRSVDQLTDSQANEIIDTMIQLKEQELSFRKELVNNLRTFLPPQKIIKLKKAEDNFKKMLLQRLKQRKGK